MDANPMTAEPSPLVALRDVSYRAGGRRILNSASWTIRRGAHWAILGPNGAGKTTLLKLACGYLWPNDGGEIRRLGKRLTDLRELRRSIGWVTLSLARQIPSQQTVHDTVVAGRFAQTALVPMSWDPVTKADRLAATQFLEQLDATSLAKQPFGTLSQGEQQKVLLARARMAKPLLIILDEPCAGLDPGARERLLTSIEPLVTDRAGPGMVLVTHRLEEILAPFDNLLLMRDGRITTICKTADITAAQLAELYDAAPKQLIRESGRVWPIW